MWSADAVDVVAPLGSHLETNVHGIEVQTPNENTQKNGHGNDVVADKSHTEKNAHGNDVPVQAAEGQQIEAQKIEAARIEAAQIEATQIDAAKAEAARLEAAKAAEKRPDLIEEWQFGVIDDIFNSAGKLSIGAAMRGMKQGVDEIVAMVQPEAAAVGSVAVAQGMASLATGQSAQGDALDGASARVADEAGEPLVARKPAVVIELPSDTVKILASMKNDSAMSFVFQDADRGQVLGTGAQHGIAFRQDGGQRVAASASV
jgi:hypothetical protein